MNLMIVESPNKVKKIKSILDALGSGPGTVRWDVSASVGHIRDLPIKDLGVAAPEYLPQYELTERGRDVVKRLKTLAAKADQVYLATDPDREGEAISWHLKETLHLRRYQRVTFDAITSTVITRALENPRQIDAHLVQAQEARRVLDRLVGYQVSPVLSRQTAHRGLSAGRVQSPAVRLVVDREREIQAFKETKHFGAEVSFDANAWRAQWDTSPFLPKGEKYLMDESLAKRAAACRDFTVTSSDNKHATQPPPPPFTTSTLLQAASVTLGLKPDVTAQLAQKLFEAGLITYHRTDSQNFSAEALKEVRTFAGKRKLPLPSKPRSWKARGGAQEAHEAIRPTHFETEHAGDDKLQQSLYRLIWQRAVASQLADAEYSVNTLVLTAAGQAGLAPISFAPEAAASESRPVVANSAAVPEDAALEPVVPLLSAHSGHSFSSKADIFSVAPGSKAAVPSPHSKAPSVAPRSKATPLASETTGAAASDPKPSATLAQSEPARKGGAAPSSLTGGRNALAAPASTAAATTSGSTGTDAAPDAKTATHSPASRAKRFTFKAVGRTLLKPGWKALTSKDEAEEDEPSRDGDNENCGKVPLLPPGAAARAETGRVLYKQTRPPARYTQASLIKKLESIGIGRPSTYPAILKNVMTRGYLQEDRKFLSPTDLGCLVVDTLQPRFRFLDYAFTRDLEQELDDIAEGKADYRSVVSRADAQLQQELAKLGGPRRTYTPTPTPNPSSPSTWTPTPSLTSSSLASPSTRPPTTSPASSSTWQPARSPTYTRTNPPPATPFDDEEPAPAKKRSSRKAATTPLSASEAKPTRTRRSKKPTSEPATRRTAKTPASTPAHSHARAAEPAPASPQPHTTPTFLCPKCKAGTLRLSRDEKFYGCSRYREGCPFTLNTIIASRRLKPADIATLSASGRTAKLSGFLSKTGRPFEAALTLNEAGRIEFSFR
jgi:DNA topoisomerase IA